MFCKACGKPIEENAKFCPNCGTGTMQDNSNPISDSVVLLTLKPRFITLTAILKSLPTSLFIVIMGASLFSGVAGAYFKDYSAIPVIIVAVIALFCVIFLSCFFAFETNKKTIYHFYKTKVEYHEGFLGKDTKTLKYNRVLETELKKGIIQQIYGVGSIYLTTGGVSASGSSNGVFIIDIPNPDKNYRVIKELIDNCQ